MLSFLVEPVSEDDVEVDVSDEVLEEPSPLPEEEDPDGDDEEGDAPLDRLSVL